jgi:hypothetical protein
MEAHLSAPEFPFRRLVFPPLFLVLLPAAVVGLLIWANVPINAHGLSGAFIALSMVGCFIALAFLEVTACARAVILLNVWPLLRTTRNWLALAVGLLSVLAAGGWAVAFFA